MTPERWQRVEQLYHSAMECTSGKRAAYLASECAGDEELGREAESLATSRGRRISGAASACGGHGAIRPVAFMAAPVWHEIPT